MRGPKYIENVSLGFLDELSLDGGRTECFGRFLCRVEEERYIAVNNKRGNKLREEFKSRRTAALWLSGHLCLNIRNELCDGMTGKKILDVAERVRKEIERERF